MMMSKISSSYFAKLLLLFVGVQLLTLTGCVSEQDTSASVRSKFTGEEMFQGIFFAHGEFAAKIPSLNKFVQAARDYSEEDRQEVERMVGKLCNTIKTQDPTFFDQFERRISSKNHQEISSAIKDGSIAIYNNIELIFPGITKVIKEMEKDATTKTGKFEVAKIEANYDKYAELLNNNMLGSGLEKAPCSWAVACVYYAALAAHNTIAVTANIVAAGAIFVYLGVKLWGPGIESSEGDASQLEHEMMVDEIAMLP